MTLPIVISNKNVKFEDQLIDCWWFKVQQHTFEDQLIDWWWFKVQQQTFHSYSGLEQVQQN